MGIRLVATVTAASLLVLTTAGVASAQEQSVDRKVVQQAMDQLASGGGALGVQARVTDGRQRFTARSGKAELDSDRPVPLNGRFRVGSITKTFVSTVMLQLAGEGKVDLDAPVDRYLPGLFRTGTSPSGSCSSTPAASTTTPTHFRSTRPSSRRSATSTGSRRTWSPSPPASRSTSRRARSGTTPTPTTSSPACWSRS